MEPLTKQELISEAKKIEDPEKRIKYVMQYFLNTVSYNYAYLLGAGYAQGSISQISGKRKVIINIFARNINDNLPDFFLVYDKQNMVGESEILQEMEKIEEEISRRGGLFEESRAQVKEFLSEQLKNHINNDKIVSLNIDKLLEILDTIVNLRINVIGTNKKCGYCYSSALMEVILKKEKYFQPTTFHNGLLTSGVCKDYSTHIVPILREVGIDAFEISGTSELSHSWIAAIIDGSVKSIDLTRAVFIRDGFKGIPEEQTMEDWLYCDMDKALDMQVTRSIQGINGNALPQIIDGHNYNQKMFLDLLERTRAIEKNHTANTESRGKTNDMNENH